MTGSLQLREYSGEIVRLSCPKCGRAGQYRKRNLIERYGADIRLPDLPERLRNAGTAGCTMPAWFVTWIWSLGPKRTLLQYSRSSMVERCKCVALLS